MLGSEKLKAEILEEFPGIKFVYKNTWFWKFLSFCVLIVTFGRNKTFCDKYTTTIATYIAFPDKWDFLPEFSKQTVLYHERVHLRQQRACGLGSVWLGLLPWGLFWLTFPLPLGLAWGRYILERSAYLENVRLWREFYGNDAALMAVDHAVLGLSGPGYGWAWPFPKSIRKYFMDTLGLDEKQPPAA